MVFLGSLPYKFSNHPDTQHIFWTIGDWIGWFFGNAIGSGFSAYAGYIIGGFELIASLLIIIPILLWGVQLLGALKSKNLNFLIPIGWILAAGIMSWAVFFHLVSPLGIEVIHEGESDGGSLFRAAVSVLFIGLTLAFMYKSELKNTFIAQLPVIKKFI